MNANRPTDDKERDAPSEPAIDPAILQDPMKVADLPRQRRGENLKNVPPAQRCEHIILRKGRKPSRCKRYRRGTEPDAPARWCVTHEPLHAEKMMKIADGPDAAQQRALAELLDRPVFDANNPPMTQDEIARGRAVLLLKLEHQRLEPDVVNAMLRALKEQSEHIELYGGEQGVEGGRCVLRIMPGVTIVEQHDASTVPLTMEEVKLILEGQEDDRKHGVTPPESFAECVVRYVGRPRAATTVYGATQDPEGIREYTESGARTISFAETEQRARARWKRLREQRRAFGS